MTTFKFKLTTQVALETLESNAQTFGELKRDIQNSELADKISFERKTEKRDGQEWTRTIKLIERNTQAEYGAIDDARLPAGDSLIFFVTPIEHKGGLVAAEDLHLESYEVLESELEELGYNEIRSFGSKLNRVHNANIDLSGRRYEMLENILDWLGDFYTEQEEEVTVDIRESDDVVDLLSAAVHIIVRCIDLLESDEAVDVVDNTTLTQLHEDALELQRKMNAYK